MSTDKSLHCDTFILTSELSLFQSGQLDCYTTSTLSLVSLLPTVECISPQEVLMHLKSGKASSEDKVLMDQKEFQSASYQRVYQYLKRHDAGENLDDFIYQSSIEDTPSDCLDIICRYCGVLNPSWYEISHFVRFLNIQLHSSETSHYLKKTVTGLKTFVVKFLVRMSKVIMNVLVEMYVITLRY